MLQGIYVGVQGMVPQMQKQDQIANNLANINTTGFKQSNLFIKSYQKYLSDNEGRPYVNSEIRPDDVYTDFREGPMRKTGATFDLALKGDGFFSIMTENGVRYTRNGSFTLDKEGFLVNSEGSKVLGTEGYIHFEELKKNVSINEGGQVFYGSDLKARLRIVDFAKPYELAREGDSCFRPLMPENPEKQSQCAVHQGFLEASNVNAVKNMVDMITSFRTYEAGQKALMAQNDTLDKAVNMIGKIG